MGATYERRSIHRRDRPLYRPFIMEESQKRAEFIQEEDCNGLRNVVLSVQSIGRFERLNFYGWRRQTDIALDVLYYGNVYAYI